jgi:hypothetical protein
MGSLDPTLYSILVMAVAVLLIGSISFAITAKNPKLRFWGCRIASAFFVLCGIYFIAYSAFTGASLRVGFFWALLMFAVAGWQWSLSPKSEKSK